MTREIVRIVDLPRRMAEHGRIRLGEKGNKGQPVKLDHFRFTSHDKDAIDQIAALYGGTVKPWNDKQHEVKTEAEAIPVVLPPDPLGGTPVYELWSKGGCQRRCDGETAVVSENGPDGAELVDVPCICTRDGALACKPTTRLTVVLPDITFGGGWRMESNGWNVAHELPGMVDTIMEFAQRGFTRAHLALESRKSVSNGRTRQYVVPVLRPAVSLDALASGEGNLRTLALAPAPIVGEEGEPESRVAAAPAPPSSPTSNRVDTSWEDDEIVDAEIVEEAEPAVSGDAATAPSSTSIDSERPFTDDDKPMAEEMAAAELGLLRRRMHAVLNELGMGVIERHALVKRVTEGARSSSNDLDVDEMRRLLAALDAIRAGKAEMSGVDENGMAVVVRV